MFVKVPEGRFVSHVVSAWVAGKGWRYAPEVTIYDDVVHTFYKERGELTDYPTACAALEHIRAEAHSRDWLAHFAEKRANTVKVRFF